MHLIITIIAMIPYYFVAIQVTPDDFSATNRHAANLHNADKKPLWGVQQLKTVNNHS